MSQRKRLTVSLRQEDIDVFKLDALLAHSTVSERLRKVLEQHAKELNLGQPRSMFPRPPGKDAQP